MATGAGGSREDFIIWDGTSPGHPWDYSTNTGALIGSPSSKTPRGISGDHWISWKKGQDLGNVFTVTSTTRQGGQGQIECTLTGRTWRTGTWQGRHAVFESSYFQPNTDGFNDQGDFLKFFTQGSNLSLCSGEGGDTTSGEAFSSGFKFCRGYSKPSQASVTGFTAMTGAPISIQNIGDKLLFSGISGIHTSTDLCKQAIVIAYTGCHDVVSSIMADTGDLSYRQTRYGPGTGKDGGLRYSGIWKSDGCGTLHISGGSGIQTSFEDDALLITFTGCQNVISSIIADTGDLSYEATRYGPTGADGEPSKSGIWKSLGCDTLHISGGAGIQTEFENNTLWITSTGCDKSISTIITDSGDWSPSGACDTLHISGCSGIQTLIEDDTLLICFTGSQGSGCQNAISTIIADTGDSAYRANDNLWSASGCDTLHISGCSGIQTSMEGQHSLGLLYGQSRGQRLPKCHQHDHGRYGRLCLYSQRQLLVSQRMRHAPYFGMLRNSNFY